MLEVEQYDYIRTGHRVYGKSIEQFAGGTDHRRDVVSDRG